MRVAFSLRSVALALRRVPVVPFAVSFGTAQHTKKVPKPGILKLLRSLVALVISFSAGRGPRGRLCPAKAACSALIVASLAALSPPVANATPLVVELEVPVDNLSDGLSPWIRPGDALQVRFEIRSDAENASDSPHYGSYPLGLAHVEIAVGDLTLRSRWGDFVIARGQAAPYGANATFRVLADPDFAHRVEPLPAAPFEFRQFLLTRGVPPTIDPHDPRGLLDLPAGPPRNSASYANLSFTDIKSGEELAVFAPQAHVLVIALPEPSLSYSLAAAAVGLAGLWRGGRRRPYVGGTRTRAF